MARKRRSFPIKISTDFSKRDVQEAVFLDLVHKHPRGPNGTLTKDDYSYWGTDPKLDNNDESICGYRPVDLFRMIGSMDSMSKTATDEWDYRGIVRELWPDVGDRGVTRRSRRLASRIGRAVRKIYRDGLPGVWTVKWGYGDFSKVVVAANSENDAINQAKIFFGPFIEDEWRLGASFMREGSQLELLNSNQPMIDAIESRKDRIRSKIKEMEEEIEQYDCLKSLVEVYSISCLEG